MNVWIELMQSQAQAPHEYFAELENQSLLDLPRDQEELDEMKSKDPFGDGDCVREERALYAIKKS